MEVFELLEAIYGAFDKIALRRKVFKVETVSEENSGDENAPRLSFNVIQASHMSLHVSTPLHKLFIRSVTVM